MLKLSLSTIASGLLLLSSSIFPKLTYAFTFNVNTVSADWQDVPGSTPITDATSSSIFWGEPPTNPDLINLLPVDQRPNLSPGAPLEEQKSGLKFVGGGFQTVEIGQPFLLGTLFHFNNPVLGGTAIDQVAVDINLDFTVEPDTATPQNRSESFTFQFGIDEASNGSFTTGSDGVLTADFLTPRPNALIPWQAGTNCKYVGTISCPDRIFPTGFLSAESVDVGGADYTLGLVGFSEDEAGSVLVGGITEEGRSQQADFYVFGRLVETPEANPPQVMIGEDQAVDEGELFGFSAQSDTPDLNYEWDLDGDSTADYDEFAGPNGQWFFSDEGTYPIRLNVSDGSTLALQMTSTVSVNNVAPEITSLTGNLSVLEDEIFQFAAEAFDPGTEDILTFEWDLDGDNIYDDFVGSAGNYAFTSSGLFSIGLRVSDGDGGETFGVFEVDVAHVPESSPQIALLCLTCLGLGQFTQRRFKV